jgi:ubiquinone/menaquinone biosynthesis C-methylase UbiE
MIKVKSFEEHVKDYDSWYDENEAMFESEAEALREMLPIGDLRGIEIGVGTGRFALALGLKEGVEPLEAMRLMALERGIEVMPAEAEHLPYKDMQFDFVLMAYCISYIMDVHTALKEVNRVLKHDGAFILGFIEKNSAIGRHYAQKRQSSVFYRQAIFYSVDKLQEELKRSGFKKFEFRQTLFGNFDEITEFQPSQEGYDKGSYIVIKAQK